ncbi:MAG: hypothetical protein J0H49_21185 [Acidobacteria bacterium]|nr:hypothetical protein [Acidobacteriota bacterium]
MLLPSVGAGGALAPVLVGAGLIYAGAWIIFHPAGSWQLAQDMMDGIQRFESSLHGAPWWSVQTSHRKPPASLTFRLAGAIVAALGVVSLAGGLSRWA